MNQAQQNGKAVRSTKSVTEVVGQIFTEFRGLERNLQSLENTTPLLGEFPIGTTPRLDGKMEKLVDARGGAQPYLPEVLEAFREHIFFLSQHIGELDLFFRQQYGLPTDSEPTTAEYANKTGYADIPKGCNRG